MFSPSILFPFLFPAATPGRSPGRFSRWRSLWLVQKASLPFASSLFRSLVPRSPLCSLVLDGFLVNGTSCSSDPTSPRCFFAEFSTHPGVLLPLMLSSSHLTNLHLLESAFPLPSFFRRVVCGPSPPFSCILVLPFFLSRDVVSLILLDSSISYPGLLQPHSGRRCYV